jgi:type IV pilus assembly protein PilE
MALPLHRSALPQRAGGLTLIELMVIVAVVAILGALALPSYMDSVRKGRRSEAVAALTQLQQAQERWRANNATYTMELTADPNATPPGLGLPSTSSSGLYTIRIDAASAAGYTVSATAVAGTSQANDTNCSTMRVRLANGNVQYGGSALTDPLTDVHRCWSR